MVGTPLSPIDVSPVSVPLPSVPLELLLVDPSVLVEPPVLSPHAAVARPSMNPRPSMDQPSVRRTTAPQNGQALSRVSRRHAQLGQSIRGRIGRLYRVGTAVQSGSSAGGVALARAPTGGRPVRHGAASKRAPAGPACQPRCSGSGLAGRHAQAARALIRTTATAWAGLDVRVLPPPRELLGRIGVGDLRSLDLADACFIFERMRGIAGFAEITIAVAGVRRHEPTGSALPRLVSPLPERWPLMVRPSLR